MDITEIPRGDGTNTTRPDEAHRREGRGDGPTTSRADGRKPLHPRIAAVLLAARYHGVDLDPQELDVRNGVSFDALTAWIRESGMWARHARLKWRKLVDASAAGPIIVFFKDGGAGLLTAADPARNIVFIQTPNTSAVGTRQTPTTPVDELRLSELWDGEVLLLRAEREQTEADPPFTVAWLAHMVFGERRALRDIGVASLTLSFLTIFPPLVVMTVVDRVLTHRTISTLVLLAVILGIAVIYETLLGHARRLIILTVGTKMDTRLNLLVFNRLLRLPLDYFERHPAGETMHKIGHIYKIREFLTGKLLSTFLDLITLLVLLPVLFYLNIALAAMVLVCAAVIGVIIFGSLRPLRVMFARVAAAETDRSAALGETIFGIRTIKSLVLERPRRSMWDERVARVGRARMAFGRLASWPQTLITPLERFMSIGVILIGAYMAMFDTSGYAAGALFAFMMLSMRVAQPLVNLAKLFEDYEEVGAAIGEAASVLNRPLEGSAASRGLRPRITGAVTFDKVSYAYPGVKTPALDRVSFDIKAGSLVGIVGRSGSGKSTIVRLLQGITRDFVGALRVDGNDLREFNLRYLRQSFGVVLQDNFLFRGSIRDNIIAARPGLTTEDAVRAARLAGADEFIERMPQGYETIIEEGSPNLSGGQRQRLAIARALITNPPILILDEPTSALDPESEALVNENILSIGRDRTTIIVSHRLSSLTNCDQILVLDQGAVVDMADHETLLSRCPLYRQLWTQQTGGAQPLKGAEYVVFPKNAAQ